MEKKRKEKREGKKRLFSLRYFLNLLLGWRNYSQGEGVLQRDAIQDWAPRTALPGNPLSLQKAATFQLCLPAHGVSQCTRCSAGPCATEPVAGCRGYCRMASQAAALATSSLTAPAPLLKKLVSKNRYQLGPL